MLVKWISKRPTQLTLTPGNPGKILPTIPNKQHNKPAVTKKISITVKFVLLKNYNKSEVTMKTSKFILIFFLFIGSFAFSQTVDEDAALKERLYQKYKKEVLSFTHKDFDELFFSFVERTGKDPLLTKEEYYTFTCKIAAYSERLGKLYKSERETAEKSKQEWLAKSYQDYVNSRKTR